MLNMIENGKLALAKVVSRRISLNEVNEVMNAMGRYGTTGLVVIDQF